jgi:hypothetical protein
MDGRAVARYALDGAQERDRGALRQPNLICPAPLAEALELEKGEPIEWVIEDRLTLNLKRRPTSAAPSTRNRDAR